MPFLFKFMSASLIGALYDNQTDVMKCLSMAVVLECDTAE